MSNQGDEFVDATSSDARPTPFPEVVAGFEALGFGVVGRIGRRRPEDLWREAAAYPKERRLEYCEQRAVPSVVLASPDGSAFVVVAWWWGMPDVRIRTALDDGSVVETLRAWDRDPVWPSGRRAIHRHGDLREEQLMFNVPDGGRVVTLAGGTATDLWEAHRRSVLRVSDERTGRPVAHSDVDSAVDLSNRLARHQVACRRNVIRRSLLWPVLAAALVVVVAAWTSPPMVTFGLLLGTLAVLGLEIAFMKQLRGWALRRRYAPARRPPLEGVRPSGRRPA